MTVESSTAGHSIEPGNATSVSCSVIICTRNRAPSLKRTLASLEALERPSDGFEILVVDNGSTDNTREVVQNTPDPTGRVHYIYEPTPGLSNARNCGLGHAMGDIVFYIDDDAVPVRRDWVTQLLTVFDDPSVAAAGGDLIAVWPEGTPPEWLHPELWYSLGITRFQSNSVAETHYPLYPWGANIAFRRKTIVDHGGFRSDLGRIGESMLSGEETDLCLRLALAGNKVLYVPGAEVNHHIAPSRLTLDAICRHARAQGVSEALIESRNFSRLRRKVALLRRVMLLPLYTAISRFPWTKRFSKLYTLSVYKRLVFQNYLQLPAENR